MADIKIGGLPALGAAPASADLVEITDTSESLSKSATMENIGDYIKNALVYVSARSTAGQVITSNVTLIEYESNITDPYSAWTGDNTFTAPHAADYLITATITNTAGGRNSIRIKLNGNNHMIGAEATNAASSTPSIVSYTMRLEAGDEITFTFNSNKTRNTNGFQNALSIVEVG
tara:strand:- start:2376 stop:2900 length:525 start_codon:yes stop_codon:yes gene_type:complete